MDTMVFLKGQKVFYPFHGISIIEGIVEKEFDGRLIKFYHLKLLSNYSSVFVPVSDIREIGVRRIMSEKEASYILSLIESMEVNLNSEWKCRYRENEVLLKSGDPKSLIFVLKNLYFLSKKKNLSFREKEMMKKAKELLAAEIAEAKKWTYQKAFERIEIALKKSIKSLQNI